jgi:hypothetical protein
VSICYGTLAVRLTAVAKAMAVRQAFAKAEAGHYAATGAGLSLMLVFGRVVKSITERVTTVVVRR